MQRRTLLKICVGSAIAVAAVGGGIALVGPGLDGKKLSRDGHVVFEAFARAVLDGSLPADAPLPPTIECDVAIVGSGAGAGITAELMTRAGLTVVIVEEGPLRSSSDFRLQREGEAYPQLYQESAGGKTADKAINILQGRCVGGSTTVNWTSSFRTPSATLAVWRERFGLAELTDDALSPWFAQAERRLSIGPWLHPPNENSEVLRRSALKIGIPAAAIQRSAKGCWNLGSCGLGCPTNAKQSMLLTAIPAALDRGAMLLVQTRALEFAFERDRVVALCAVPVSLAGDRVGSTVTRIVARHYVVADGAINSPAMLLRSKIPDPYDQLGRRTFPHPVVLSTALFDQRVEAWSGAPQRIYTDHFLETQPVDGPIGYKIEAPPMHPVIAASTLAGYGAAQAKMLGELAHRAGLIALLRDGFHPESSGGSVTLRSDGTPLLGYPLSAYVMDGVRRAFLSMAELQFAAGARTVSPVHEMARPYTRRNEARNAIDRLPMKPRLTRVASAHVMGGCAIAPDAKGGVTRSDGRHRQIENLSIHDGSLFPTSIGANPQLSIYDLVNKLATSLARVLSGREVRLV